ncbi:MAG: hypothetical protein QW367_01765 [Candidatus Aenigmatarchaeota archaeon]
MSPKNLENIHSNVKRPSEITPQYLQELKMLKEELEKELFEYGLVLPLNDINEFVLSQASEKFEGLISLFLGKIINYKNKVVGDLAKIIDEYSKRILYLIDSYLQKVEEYLTLSPEKLPENEVSYLIIGLAASNYYIQTIKFLYSKIETPESKTIKSYSSEITRKIENLENLFRQKDINVSNQFYLFAYNVLASLGTEIFEELESRLYQYLKNF